MPGGARTLMVNGGSSSIGENASAIRARICKGLSFLGVQFNENRNAAGEPVISADAHDMAASLVQTKT